MNNILYTDTELSWQIRYICNNYELTDILLRFDIMMVSCVFSALYISVLLMFFVYILASAVGLVVYAYYRQKGCDPIRADYITSPNQVLS